MNFERKRISVRKQKHQNLFSLKSEMVKLAVVKIKCIHVKGAFDLKNYVPFHYCKKFNGLSCGNQNCQILKLLCF